jgi:hypothetical protein
MCVSRHRIRGPRACSRLVDMRGALLTVARQYIIAVRKNRFLDPPNLTPQMLPGRGLKILDSELRCVSVLQILQITVNRLNTVSVVDSVLARPPSRGVFVRKFVSTFKSRLFAKETDSRWFLMICAIVPVGADQGAGGISRANSSYAKYFKAIHTNYKQQ